MSNINELREMINPNIELVFSENDAINEVYNNYGPQSKAAWNTKNDYRIYVRTRSDGDSDKLIRHSCTFKLYGGDLNGMEFNVSYDSYINNTSELTSNISNVRKMSSKLFSQCVKNFVFYNQALLIVYFDAYRPSDEKARKEMEQEFENRRRVTHNYMSGSYTALSDKELKEEIDSLYKQFNAEPWGGK